jgi:hypothetical protein
VDGEQRERRGEEPDDGLDWLPGDEPAPEADVEASGGLGSSPTSGHEDGGDDGPSGGGEIAPTQSVGGGSEPPRHHPIRLLFLGLPLALFLLIGWNRAASSDQFCASCHATAAAVLSSERSIHADVSCIACHSGSGVAGTVKYVPTLLREGLATVTGLSAQGVLEARGCISCHPDLSASAHPEPLKDCTTCHGNVSHPELQVPGAQSILVAGGGHPTAFIQVHGASATDDPGTCKECHKPKFCEACHLRETFPHPDGWIEKHGAVQEQRGGTACETCHGPTFCSGCHGTEIPHRADWLARHDTALIDAPTTPCLTCHPETDCSTCHSEHAVHREQDLYLLPSPQPIPKGGR